MFSFYSDIPKSNYSKLIFCPREEDPGLAVILLINITGADIKKNKKREQDPLQTHPYIFVSELGSVRVRSCARSSVFDLLTAAT